MNPYLFIFIRTLTRAVCLAFFAMMLFFNSLKAQTTLYSETFTASNGTTSGTGNPAKWTHDVSGTSPTVGSIQSNQLQYQDLDGEAVWSSAVIPIYGWTSVSASIDISESGTLEADDYIRVYYKLNGGTETYFTTNGNNTDDFGTRTASESGLSGNTLQIIIRIDNDAPDDNHYIDNVTVSGDVSANTLYTENFTGYSNGTNSSSNWTISSTGASPTIFSVQRGRFQQTDADATVTWTSTSINISGCTNVSASVDISESGTLEGDDNIRVYYKIAGVETLFPTNGSKYDDFGSATATVSGLSGSSLQIVIKSDNDRTDEHHYWDNITITGNCGGISAISLSVGGTNTTACTSAGSVNLTASGGQAPYTFSWSNGAGTEDLSNLAAGTYTVTVTDNQGTTASTSRVVSSPGLPSPTTTISSNYNGAHVSCTGSTNGSVDLSVSGGKYGTGTFANYGISFDGTDDYINCGTGSSISLSGTAITVEAWIKPVSMGADNGIVMKTSADTWTDGYGLYVDNDNRVKFYINHYNNNVAYSTFTLDGQWHHVAGTYDGSTIRIFVDGVEGTSDVYSGSIVNASNNLEIGRGFSNTYNYQGSIDQVRIWNTAVSGTNLNNYKCIHDISAHPNIANLKASYRMNEGTGISVADNSGNSNTGTISGSATWISGSNVNYGCYQQMGYVYSWSSGAITEDISGIGAGTYTVTVTDADGCTASSSKTLNNPTALSPSASVTNATCPLASNGAVNLTVSGGTGSKTYQWSSGQTSEDISSLILDDYTVTVTDANGCTASTTATVGSTNTLSSITAVTHVTTPGGTNGAITQTVSGGTGPYTYLWSNGATTKDISGLSADGYSVTITDNSGCQFVNAASVSEIVSIYCENFNSYSNGTTSGSTWTQTCTSCTLGGDGDWEVQSNKWEAEDLDNVGIWTSSSINISGYRNVSVSVDLTDVGNQGTDDYIRVYYKINSGTNTLFSSNGDNTDDIPSGSRTATQTGLDGLTLQIVIQVFNNNGAGIYYTFDNVCVTGESVMDLAFSQSNVNCNGGSTGSIDLTVHNFGATPPFTYSWSNGASTQDISGLAAGAYTVTVTDNSGSGTFNQTLSGGSNDADQSSGGVMDVADTKLQMVSGQRMGLRFTNVSIPQGATITNAYVEFVAETGNSGSCSFTFSGQATDDASSFTTSASNISSRTQTSATVTWSSMSSWSAGNTYTSPNLASIISEIVNRSGWSSGNDLVIMASSTGTRNPASFEHATYTAPRLVVSYSDPISKTGSVTITQPTALSANISATNTSCPTSTNGAANLTASGGTAPRTFLWSNGITAEDLTGLKTGSYTVTVTDANGCTATANTTVNSTSNISSTLTVTNITTPGGADGAIAQTVTGASGTPTFVWSDGASTSEDRTNLSMGSYRVTITDNAGCTKTKSAIVLDPESISCQDFSGYADGTTSGPWTQTCSGCSQIDFEVQGGQWAAYDLDNVGVWTSNSINISGYSNVRLSVSLSETDVLESNDYIRVYYKLDGGGEIQFATNGNMTDDFGSATAVQTGLSGSTVQIVVRVWNDSEHHYFDNVCVVGYPPFYLETEGTDLICNGGSDGAIDLTVTNGSGTLPFSFNWSNGATTEDITGLTAGTYTVTVTDNAGIARTTQVTLTQPATTISVNNTIVNVTCHGGSDATIILAVSGGSSPYTFLWSNGSEMMNPSGLSAGTYTVTITDNSGCTVSNNYVVSSPTLPLDMTFTGTPSYCTGGSTQLVASGAQNYSWTPSTGLSATNVANPVINPASTTTYYVTASSPGASNLVANGGFESGNIGFTTQYAYTTNNLYPEGRYGIGTNANSYHSNFFSSGDHTSGSGKFMIINGATTINMKVWCQNLNVQPGASYAFSTWISSVHPSNPAQLEFSINGTLLGTPITAPSVRYQWNQFTANWTSNTSSAEFCIVNRNTIAGGNDFALDDIVITPNCSDTDTITVTVNTLPTAIGDADGGANQNICYGETAELEASGGATYAWSNGVNTAANNVSPTTDTDYRVTVTDDNGCSASDTVSVNVHPEIVVVTDSVSQIICGGASTGYIHISVSGGASPYTYAWSNGATSQDIDDVVAGVYTVTVTDNNSCTVVHTDTLDNIPDKTITFDKTDISCNNLNDGSINVSVSGGNPPYTFAWSTGASAQNLAGLSAGTYTVTVTGINNCPNSASTTIVNPAVLTPTASVTNITCNGLTNGAIDVSVSGGWTPYTYSWSGGQTTQDRSSLVVGNYTVTITDNRSCTATLSRAITQPAVLSTSMAVTNVSCKAGSNGEIDLSVNGGTSPYSYNWSAAETTQDIASLAADEYWVTVTDANNCIKVDSVIVNEPASELEVTLTITDVTCMGLEDGSVTINPVGGTAPYTYLGFAGNLPGPVDSSSAFIIDYVPGFIDSLSPLALTFVVTDDNGCSATVSGDVGSEGPLLSFVSTDISCGGGASGAIDMTVSGESPFTYAWSNGASTEDISSIVAGYYEVTVTDSSGCIGAGGVDISEPSFSSSVTVTNSTCPYSTNGAVDLTVNDGIAPFSYAWSNGATTQDLSNIAAGTYTVTVTDAAECTITDMATISALSNIATSMFVLDVSANGGSNGSISQTVSGGVAPYTYAWSNGALTKDLTNLSAGTYSVTITGANGCTFSTSRTVNQPGACPCLWLGTTSNSWNVATNWDCGLVPTDTCNVIIQPAANNCTILGGTAACRNLTIQPGATLAIINTAGIDIYGNFENNGTFTRNSSTVRFTGTNEQTISGSAIARFYNLHINNKSASGVRMTKSIEVHNEMRLIDGYLFAGRDSVKMMNADEGKLNVFSANSFVVGRISRKINNNQLVGYQFPVGDAGMPSRFFSAYIKSFELKGTTQLTVWFDTLRQHSNTQMTSAYYNPPNDVDDYYNYEVPYVKISSGDTITSTTFGLLAGVVNGVIDGVTGSLLTSPTTYVNNVFNMEKTVETDGIMYSFMAPEGIWHFEPDQQPTGGYYHMMLGIQNFSGLSDNNFGVLKRPTGTTGAYWSAGGGNMNPFGGLGRKLSDGIAMRMYLTTFSEGGAGGGGGGGLPIELLDFKAKLVGDDVELTWVTATEINNDYFTIEKSNGTEFQQIAIVPGAGNSSSTKYYSKIDYEPFRGTSYYRLKQTDYDGQFTYSDVVSVTYEPSDSENEDDELLVYPNPSGGNFSVVVKNASEEVVLSLFDNRGKLVMTETYSADQDNYTHQVTVKGIPSGVYYLKADMGEKVRYTKKLMLFGQD